MALVKRPITERMRQASRSNARLSTGPRTAAGKARSRLNGIRHGLRSRLFTEYFRLWYNSLLIGPWEPPLRWDVAKLPVPFLCRPGTNRWRALGVREFLFRVTPYLAPGAKARGANKRRMQPPPGEKRDPLKMTREAVKLLKTQEGFQKTGEKEATPNRHRTAPLRPRSRQTSVLAHENSMATPAYASGKNSFSRRLVAHCGPGRDSARIAPSSRLKFGEDCA